MDWQAEGKEYQAEIITTMPGKYRWFSLAYFYLFFFFFLIYNEYMLSLVMRKSQKILHKKLYRTLFSILLLADFTLASKKLNSSNHRQQRKQKPGAHSFAQDPHSTRLRASAALPPSCISALPQLPSLWNSQGALVTNTEFQAPPLDIVIQ